ncbi:methyltransferase domain-containing protein [Paracoccus cavernae]|uniref:methyltransferase domain-containing protein n=1 Tax=Paracoccus cavernae TaxID=1571207 RepID=UPI003636EB02
MTALPLERIARSFHRHRASYDDHATPQSLVARDLARRLDRASGTRHFDSVFEFGCGSGHLTRALAARFAIGQLALNDLVAQALPQDLPCPARFRTGPVEDAELPARIDLLASASTIQWLADPAATLARLCARVARGGWLAVSGFGPAQFRELSAQNGAGALADDARGDGAPSARGLAGRGLRAKGVAAMVRRAARSLAPPAQDRRQRACAARLDPPRSGRLLHRFARRAWRWNGARAAQLASGLAGRAKAGLGPDLSPRALKPVASGGVPEPAPQLAHRGDGSRP